MWGWLPGRLILSGPCSWVRAGRGAAARGKQGGWLVLWCLACVVGAGVGLVAWCWHRRHARRASASCLCGEWGVVGAPACVGVACCRGSGAVRPGCLTCVLLPCVGGGSRVWVGWL